jgi:hypothetical protein
MEDCGVECVASVIRVHKLTVLPKSGIVRQIGRLTKPDRDALGRGLGSGISRIACGERSVASQCLI